MELSRVGRLRPFTIGEEAERLSVKKGIRRSFTGVGMMRKASLSAPHEQANETQRWTQAWRDREDRSGRSYIVLLEDEV